MNVYDSGRMLDTLKPLGYNAVDTPEAADVVLLNTCHIREKAAEKVYSELGRMKQLRDRKKKENKGDLVIGVAGCVAQAEGAEMLRRAPYVDLVVGTQAYHRLPEMLARAQRSADFRTGKGRGVLDTDFPAESKFDYLPEAHTPQGVSAFVTIQEGCDKFCSFCVVPYTRGAEFSRPAAAIISEAQQQVSNGAKEIYLLGQNVNAWHGEGLNGKEWNFGRLLFAIAEQVNPLRLRYTTSHPRDMHADLYKAHADIPALMPFLHLPVQSGSNRVLEMMNRKHKVDMYYRVVDALRRARPDMALSSDFIVGYPGESDKDFEDTMTLVRQVGYAQAFSFKYSPRAGTPAAMHEDKIPEHVKQERLNALQALLAEQQALFNTLSVGLTMPVLMERHGREEGSVVGRTPYMQLVHTAGVAVGDCADVVITSANQNSVRGTIMMPHQTEKVA